MLANEEVFGVVDILVRACLYAVDNLPASSAGKYLVLQRSVYSRLKINQNRPGNVSCVVAL